MKTAAKSIKALPGKPKPKSNLKLAIGKYKGVIVEKDDCWDDDLKKTIPDR
ncbi:hypothetical protein [Larkinella punicea]|jgi:hypothetical protein|uniref:hypothetical protein n=1 Tax=Larkinella punicea TaxID=2315727 RepID=UPI001403B915|nr:hypothetical protein [Larkinella punicea]